MANEEQLILSGLTLNDSTFGLAELSCPPPKQRQEWIGAADSEWQALTRNPLHENREVVARIQVNPQSTMDLAHDKVALVIDKLRLASRTPDGVALTWTPATGTRTVTFDVLAGEITDLPIDWASGWLALAPTFTIRMVCKPYWRGTETLVSTASSSTPFVAQEITGVTGDIPALGRLIVTDTATQHRRHVEWGVEGQFYNAATSLLVDSDDMVVSGFGGTQTTTTGAYDPNAAGNNSITCALTTNATGVAGVGNLSHVGTFLVKGRVQATAALVEVRLVWQAADGPVTANDWVTLTVGASAWEELDLGTITVPVVLAGTQRWTGRIEARTTTGTNTLILDYLILIPTLEGYGKARATTANTAGTVTGYDQFTSTTAGNVLNARVAPAGGTWATSGVATDFVFTDFPLATDETVKRITAAEASPRFAILGTATPADVQVSASVYATIPFPATIGDAISLGVIARWVDSSNYLFARVYHWAGGGAFNAYLQICQVVAGTPTTIASLGPSSVILFSTWNVIELTAYATGRVIVRLLDATGAATLRTVDGTSTAVATGGALATGKSGLYDHGNATSGGVRCYDNFAVSTPSPEPIIVYSGRNMQIRYDDTIRQDSTGTYIGRPASYRGSRFLVPTGTSRVIVKARRADIETSADANVTDATQIQVGWTPRGIAVPRA